MDFFIINTIFVKIYEDKYNQRIAAKRAGRMLESETKKLLLNSVTGNYQNEYSWLYSPFAVMQIKFGLKIFEKIF